MMKRAKRGGVDLTSQLARQARLDPLADGHLDAPFVRAVHRERDLVLGSDAARWLAEPIFDSRCHP